MADNSLASLLAWMKEGSRLLGWGLIVAVERRKANLLIIQEYIKRFASDSYLPAITGEVTIVENQFKEYIHDFVLDVPRLSFVDADLNDSKAMLTMVVMGGSQISLRKEGTGWKADKVDEIDPLQGPKLYLDLLLNEIPGDVETDGRLKLDLSKSDNFRLTFGQTPHQQRVGGDFFKDLFNQLPDEQRVYPLGKIQRGTNDLIRPESFELRTQSRKASESDEEGAILAPVRMIERNGGDYPGQGFRYLIPDDAGKDYSATVLFDRRRVATTALIAEIARLFGTSLDNGFEYIFDEDRELKAVTAKTGEMTVPAQTSYLTLRVDEFWSVVLAVKLDTFVFSAVSPNAMVIEVVHGQITIRWKSTTTTECNLSDRDITGQIIKCRVEGDVNLVATYDFIEDGNNAVSLQQTNFTWEGGAVVTHSEGEAEYWIPNTVEKIRSYIEQDCLNKSVQSIFESTFSQVLKVDVSVNSMIDETIKLNFGQIIQGTELRAPHDLGLFGRINPTQNSFTIKQMEPLLLHGEILKFTTEPSVPGVKWKVDNLVASKSLPGTINENTGEYVAPADTAFEGRYARVRVTATAPGTGYFSSALVTVVANAVTVNPLIQTCDIGFDGEPEAVEWLLPFTGPGSIDNSGLYSADPMATERYALITAQLPLVRVCTRDTYFYRCP